MKVINKPIEMIALCSKGAIKPIRFRLTAENEEEIVMPVKQIHHVSEMKLDGVKVRKYICNVEINDTQRLVEIIYKMDEVKWLLYRM